MHSGLSCTLALHPASADTGLNFFHGGTTIAAVFENVVSTTLCTTLASPGNRFATLATVEHVLAALSAAGVDNVTLEASESELPIMDGSAGPFAIALAGNVEALDQPRRRIVIRRCVSVRNGAHTAAISPREQGKQNLLLDVTTNFRGLGAQRVHFELAEEPFRRHIARARTFCFRSDVERMRAAGLAKGRTPDNAVVMEDDGRVLTDGGWRFKDEVCRHKLLDCIGDLRLGGCLIGAFKTVGPGHTLNLQLLRKLYRDPANYSIE